MKKIILLLLLSLLFISCDEDITAPEYPSLSRSQIYDKDLYDIWGFSDNDIYAVGASGTFLNYNGSEWQPISSNITENIMSVWGPDPSNVYILTESEKVYHYAGNELTEVISADLKDYNFKGSWSLRGKFHPLIDEELFYFYSVSLYNLFISDDQDQIDTVNFNSYGNMYDIYGLSADDIYIAGSGGRIKYFDGRNWTTYQSNVSTYALYAIHGYDRHSLYAVGFSGAICYYHYSSDTWLKVDKPTTESLNGVWVSSSRKGYIVGDHGMLIVMSR